MSYLEKEKLCLLLFFFFLNALFYTFFFFLIYLFIYFWLCWVFVSVWRLSLAAASGGHSSSRCGSHSSSRCAGLSPSRPLLLQSTGSRRAGSVIVAHGPSYSAACGILPDQGSNPCPLHCRQILNHCATREALCLLLERKLNKNTHQIIILDNEY